MRPLPGLWSTSICGRVGGRLNRGLERALQGWCGQTLSLPLDGRAMRGEAGQPRARKAVAWAQRVGCREGWGG